MAYRDDEQVAAIIVRATKGIIEKNYDKIYITLPRATRKKANLEPTDTMSKMLRFVRRHERIPFEETLGMDWRFLGGLLNRGLVTWIERERSGGGSEWFLEPVIIH